MIPGFDCWAGYGNIDFNLAASAGYRFVWVKCQEGNSGRDPLYLRNVQRAKDAGIVTGAYHFAYPLPEDGKNANRGPKDQARLFWEKSDGLGSREGELTPALDLEWPPPQEWAKWSCTAPQINDWARECCEAMTLLWGRRPVIYTYPHWWKTLSAGADTSWASCYPLWLADYFWLGEGVPDKAPPKLSWVSKTWDDWAACQHSAEGSKVRIPGVPAVPVDRNVMKDEETLKKLSSNVSEEFGVDYPIIRKSPYEVV